MLDIAQDCTNQDSRTFKLQKREFKFYKAQPIENRKKVNSANFKSGLSPRKHLGFQHNNARYKRKTLITF